MGPNGFPPTMSHMIMLQTSTQSNKEIQSYSSASAGYQSGVLIVVRVKLL